MMEGLHGLAPDPRGEFVIRILAWSWKWWQLHMSQVTLVVCFLVVMMREACF